MIPARHRKTRRALLVALGLATLGSTSHLRSAGAEEPAPLLFFYAPEPTVTTRAALDALEQLAARRATAVIDLSPQEPPPPAAASHLRRGIEGYRDFDYQAARGYLDAGLTEAIATGAHGLTPAELSDLLLYRALVYGQLGDEASEWDDFVRAATVDPTRVLDPVRFPPRVIQTLERAVTAVVPSRASLRVVVDGPCTVSLDARAITPATPIPVIRGEHYVRVDCPGTTPYATRLLVHQDDQRLTPERVALAGPSDADAIAEGRRRGAGAVVLATIASSPRGGVTATLRRFAVASGKEEARTVVKLAGDDSAAAIAGAATRLLEPTAPEEPVTTARPRRWYQSGWLWAAAGAAVTAAVFLPLVIDPGPATGFDVTVDYPR